MIATYINWAYPVAHFPSESMTVDILTHTLSGVAVATCVASFMPTPQGRWRLLLLGAVAGALPDLDALSLWSGFDHSIGAYFGLSKGALIYTGQWWYRPPRLFALHRRQPPLGQLVDAGPLRRQPAETTPPAQASLCLSPTDLYPGLLGSLGRRPAYALCLLGRRGLILAQRQLHWRDRPGLVVAQL